MLRWVKSYLANHSNILRLVLHFLVPETFGTMLLKVQFYSNSIFLFTDPHSKVIGSHPHIKCHLNTETVAWKMVINCCLQISLNCILRKIELIIFGSFVQHGKFKTISI